MYLNNSKAEGRHDMSISSNTDTYYISQRGYFIQLMNLDIRPTCSTLSQMYGLISKVVLIGEKSLDIKRHVGFTRCKG